MGCQQNKPLWAATWSTLPHIPADTHLKGGVNLNNYFISLYKTSWDLQWAVVISRLLGLDTPAHKFQPGNWVYCKDWGTSLLQSKWRGPFQLLLTTATALKPGRVKSQIRYSRTKRTKCPQVIKKPKMLKSCFAVKVVKCLQISRKFGNKLRF